MKKKLITYKFLAKPSKAQQTIIKKSIDNARYLYNQLLHTKKVAYQEYGVSFSKNEPDASLGIEIGLSSKISAEKFFVSPFRTIVALS